VSDDNYRFMRVKDKRTGDHYDLPVSRFNEELHEEVTQGKYGGRTNRPRRAQLNVKAPRPALTDEEKAAKAAAKAAKADKAPKTSGEPSGDTNKKKEE